MGPDLLGRADAFARRKHRHQFRRDGRTPYVEHPRAVAEILRRELGVSDPETLAAALLHDTIEDTATDYDEVAEGFGRRVADLVAVLTKDKRLPESRREREYFAALARAPLAAKLCKAADTLHNLRDSDAAHRPKAAGKAKRLLRVFRRAGGLERARELLRREIGGDEMARWLFKTEPSEYSFERLRKEGRTSWTGVKNALALKHLRQVKKGDEIAIYHTGGVKAVVGLARAAADAKGYAVDIVPVRAVTPVTLAAIKSNPKFKDFPLVRMGRLSVMPVPDPVWDEMTK